MKSTLYTVVAAWSLLAFGGCSVKTETVTAEPQADIAMGESNHGPVAEQPPAPSPTTARAAITISRETTWVVEPLNDRGRIDYIAALNRAEPAVTADQNAVVGLVQVLGSGFDDPLLHRKFIEQVSGKTDLPMRSNSVISQYAYSKSQQMSSPDEFFNRCFTASTRPWTPDELPDVALWLNACDADLDKCVESIGRENYYYPLLDSLDDESAGFTSVLAGALLPLPQSCRDVARALTARGMRRAADGDMAGACRDVIATTRLGRLVGQGRTTIEFLVGTAIESIGQEAAIALINSGRLNAVSTANLLSELETLPPPARLENKLQRGERYTALDLAIAMADHGPGVLSMVSNIDVESAKLDAESIDWDMALRTINQWYDRLVSAAQQPTYSDRALAIDQLNESLKTQAKADALEVARLFQGGTSDAARSGEQIGHFIAALTVPGAAAPHVAETRCRSRHDLLLLALQLHQRRREDGQLPENLSVVEADGPVDRFTGEAVVYRCDANACYLYSLGPNQRDDGGPSSGDTDASDDVGYVLVNASK